MFCSNCGFQMTEGSSFCSNCGKALPKVPNVTAPPDAVPAPIPMPMPVMPAEPDPESKQDFAKSVLPKANPSTMPAVSAAPAPVAEPTPVSAPKPVSEALPGSVPAREVKKQSRAIKEKVTFGKGALAFCIFLIAVLSITAGIFAALYLSEIGYSIYIPPLW